MKPFMDKDFLLNTDTAKTLYHQYAEVCPIIDYHCHINPREIWEDVRFENITQVWLGGDHYKWRLMRCAGVDERYITGDASDYEKFCQWAKVLGKAIGNPLYHWSHLELRHFFGYQGALNADTAEEVWKLTSEKLQSEGFSARGLIRMCNVESLCTTDDPIDSLEWHKLLAADASFDTAVYPAWRPEKAMSLEKAGFVAYLEQLATAADMPIRTYADLKAALLKRLAYFNDNHCTLSDHSLNYVMYAPASEEAVEAIFARRLQGEEISEQDQAIFKTALMLFLSGEYKRLGWTMQLHYGVRRDNHLTRAAKLGADCGVDCIDDYTPSAQLAAFLGAAEQADALPQTILYSLSPVDNAAIDTICGCFQEAGEVTKIQHGSAWWFNDHFEGMTEHLKSLASLGYLPGFIGMLTDSRSFLSYPRHEYFRRILCRLLGEWVEDGRYPADEKALGEIVHDICCGNARRYFRFAPKKG